MLSAGPGTESLLKPWFLLLLLILFISCQEPAFVVGFVSQLALRRCLSWEAGLEFPMCLFVE